MPERIVGHVRDGFPYITLMLPGHSGPLAVEFILDTGFEGELALPQSVLSQLDATLYARHRVRLGDGTERERPVYHILLDWEEEPRLTEVLALENAPLLGGIFFTEYLIQIEMRDGGEVVVELM